MNTSQNVYSNTIGGKATPGLAVTASSPSTFDTYSNLDDGCLMETYNPNSLASPLTSDASATFFLPEFNLTNASPFTQAFGQAPNALGIIDDRFAPSVEAQPAVPTQSAEEVEWELYMAGSQTSQASQSIPGQIQAQPTQEVQTQSFLHTSGSSESLQSPYAPYAQYTPEEVLSRVYSRSNSGSPSPSNSPSATTPSQRGYSLSPQTLSLPPNAFHNQSTSLNTVSPVQLHSTMDGQSHSRTSSYAHSRKQSTQSIRDITEGMQNQVQIGQAFNYPVTPQDGPVLLPRIASHRIQHAHHRSGSIPMLNTMDPLEAAHPAPVYHPISQQYQYPPRQQYQGHQDQLSASLVYQQNPQYLCAVSSSVSKSYPQHSDFEGGASPSSVGEESGSSMFSPMVSYGHGRNLSASTSGGSPFDSHQNLSPLSCGGSMGAVATPSAVYARDNGVSGTSSTYEFSPVVQGANGLHHDASVHLKRKRSNESEFEGCDEYDDGDASYEGASPSADEDDTDYSDDSESTKSRKGKGKSNFKKGHARRPSKRQNCLSGDWDLSSFGETNTTSTSTSPIQMKSRRSGSGSPVQQRKLPRKAPKLPEGANIKVAELPPISKTDKCCPICFHVPGNGRFSDLMRHAKTHLHVPEHYVCVACSIVERSSIDGLSEFVEGEVFTRKDSCRRHWNSKHNPTGQQKWEERFCMVVDRVRKIGDAGVSTSVPHISQVSYAPNISSISNTSYPF